MKWVRLTLTLLFVFLTVFIVTGLVVTHFYGKEVKREVITALNDQLAMEVNVHSITNLNIFTNFPYASLTLNDLLIKDVSGRDTVIALSKVYLQLNVFDIAQKNYIVKKVKLSGGLGRFKFDKKGNKNFSFKAKKKSKKATKALIELVAVELDGVRIEYESIKNNTLINSNIERCELSGEFSATEFLMNIEGAIFTEIIEANNVTYILNKPLEVKTQLKVNTKKYSYQFMNSHIEIGNLMAFNLQGIVTSEPEKPTELDLKIEGNKLDVVNTLSLIPAKFAKQLKAYQSTGILDVKCRLTGKASRTHVPSFLAHFKLMNATVRNKKTGHQLKNVSVFGSFNNGDRHSSQTSTLKVDSMTARLGTGQIRSRFSINNIKTPRIDIHLNTHLDLHDFQQFVKIDTLEEIVGSLTLNAHYQGAMKSKEKYTNSDFRKAKIAGNASFSNVSFKVKGRQKSYDNLQGELVLHNNSVKVKSLSGNIESSDFHMKGVFKNALAYLVIRKEQLDIQADFHSSFLNLNQLLSGTNTTKKDTTYSLALPPNISFNLNALVDSIAFRRFKAINFAGSLQAKNRKFIARDLSMETLGGKIEAAITINAANSSNIKISGQARVAKIYIDDLFYTFENFGQQTLKSQHLKGLATFDIQFVIPINSAMKVNKRKVYALADLKIENGELIQYKPMTDIGKFTKNHKLISVFVDGDKLMKNLHHIRFNTLHNQIEISNLQVRIPKMTIRSSVLDIELAGTHHFDNRIDYSTSFFVSDLLKKKERAAQKSKWQIEKDDRKWFKLHLTMTGTVKNPIIKHNRQAFTKRVEKTLDEEKKLIKGVLKEEFGLFKNDTTATVPSTQKPLEYDVIWDEDEETPPQNKPKIKPNTKAKNKVKKKTNHEKEEEEFDDDY